MTITTRAADDEALQRAEDRFHHPRAAVGEIGELLRQARVHIVEMRQAQQTGQDDAEPAALFVRVHRVVLLGHRPAARGDRQRQVERQLLPRRPDADARHERRPGAAEDTKPRHRDVMAERIGHQIDGVTQLDERADAVVLAEGGAPGLEERLRRNHENAHLTNG
jgi:hypothetical protein